MQEKMNNKEEILDFQEIIIMIDKDNRDDDK